MERDLLLRLCVVAFCAIGLYLAQAMLRKAYRAQSGTLGEPSVVQQPSARLFFGMPNALFGLFYYGALAIAVWFAHGAFWNLVAIAAAAAAMTSLYLAYDLLLITRMPCPFCWTSHAINWTLLALLIALR